MSTTFGPLYTRPVGQRRHHYEVAFEEYLRSRRIPYVSVDEARRALLPAAARVPNGLDCPDADRHELPSLKGFDYVVYPAAAGIASNLLVDVKGRKIARGRTGAARAGAGRLESWVTLDDVRSLQKWSELFGAGFDAAFVFIYWCEAQPPDALFQEVFEHRGRWYAVRLVTLSAYTKSMRTRSERWGTVHLPSAAFERASRPFAA